MNKFSSLIAAVALVVPACAGPHGSVVIEGSGTYSRYRHRGHHLHGNHRHVRVVKEEVVQKVISVTPPTPSIQISTEQLLLFERLLMEKAAQRELEFQALQKKLKGW